MLYIYRSRASEGADLLAEDIMLLGTRAKRTRGQLLSRLTSGDRVICWGDPLPRGTNVNGVTVLNNVPHLSKFEEARKLAAANVSTIQVSQTRPAVTPRAPFTEPSFRLGPQDFTGDQIGSIQQAIITQLHRFAQERATAYAAYRNQPVAAEWLARRNNHVGGSDLLTPPTQPDFYSKKEDIVEEYRLHMFDGKSIRAGKKVQRPTRPNGQASHPWIRSFDAGWIIAYEGFRSTREQRALAKQAIEALGLTFGAVDMGLTRDNRLIVLEVNRAPGVEGGTSDAYARKIVDWVNGVRNAEER